MELGISEKRDELERGRYIEKSRSAETLKFICGPKKIGGGEYQNISHRANQDALRALGRPLEGWCAAIIYYISEYIYKIKEILPIGDKKLWAALLGRT